MKVIWVCRPASGAPMKSGSQRIDHTGTNEIWVGRDHRAWHPGLSFDDDRVSRSHAVLRQRAGTWFLEDRGSKHGTLVDGREITGHGEASLAPGAEVVMGDTAWIYAPDDWIVVEDGPIAIYGPPCRHTTNYALLHCGVPLEVGPLTAWNRGADSAPESRVRVELAGPHLHAVIELGVPRLGAGERAGIPCLDLLKNTALALLGESETWTLELPAGRPFFTQPIRVHGAWTLSLETTDLRTVAAMVLPHDPRIERVVLESEQFLHGRTDHVTFESLLRQSRGDVETAVAECLYRLFSERCQPRCSDRILCGRGYQAVRQPHRMFLAPSPGDPEPTCEGTCLDWSLLVASCLEKTGLLPLVVFCGPEKEVVNHAMVGWWCDSAPGARPVIDRNDLLEHLRKGHIQVLDMTLRCEVSELPCAEAMAGSRKRLERETWACAVDVGALRPPRGTITPMAWSLEPDVMRAHALAMETAKWRGAKRVGLTFLLYGLMANGGPVTREIFEAAGVDLRERCATLLKTLPHGEADTVPVRTDAYDKCADRSRRSAGASSVAESDLLRALLEVAPYSESLERSWPKDERDRVATELESRYPRKSAIVMTIGSIP
ncbi:MAG: FHA domain-containing protein [Candidatus Riflebacteria bacterium]|nr:FHA domain-containing protein [Candidatus Riflebacteria bacterium]